MKKGTLHLSVGTIGYCLVGNKYNVCSALRCK